MARKWLLSVDSLTKFIEATDLAQKLTKLMTCQNIQTFFAFPSQNGTVGEDDQSFSKLMRLVSARYYQGVCGILYASILPDCPWKNFESLLRYDSHPLDRLSNAMQNLLKTNDLKISMSIQNSLLDLNSCQKFR